MTGTSTVGTRRFPCQAGLRRQRHRRGLAGVWVIAAGPALLTMLCFTVEIGNLWLARGELETALEAAALAAVKEWRDTNSTSQARDFAVVYAAANTVAGSPVILNRNDGGGGVNDNFVCDGEIVLGEIRGQGCNGYIFDADSSPGGACGATVSLTIDILTRVDTKNDVQNDIRSWSIRDFSSSEPNLVIQTVTFNVGTVPPQDLEPPYFDLRSPPNGICSNTTPVGNDANFGIGTIVTQIGMAGYTFSPDCPDNTTSQTFQISFTGSAPTPFSPATGSIGESIPMESDRIRFPATTAMPTEAETSAGRPSRWSLDWPAPDRWLRSPGSWSKIPLTPFIIPTWSSTMRNCSAATTACGRGRFSK
jgi:hypothetical protein